MTEKTQAALIPSSLSELNQQLPILKQSIIIEESRPPRISQTIIFILILLLLALIGWTAITPVKQIVKGQGEIVATDKIKGIQHLDGGIISEINIHEGDFVQEKQVLAYLASNDIQSGLDALAIKEQTLQVKADRLRAFGLNQDFDVTQYPNAMSQAVADQKAIYNMQLRNRDDQRLNIMNQIEQQRAQLALTLGQEHDLRYQVEAAEQQREIAKTLLDKKIGSKADFRRAEDNLSKLRQDLNTLINHSQEIRQHISKQEGELIELDTQLRNNTLKEMEEVTSELAAINEQKIRLKDQLNRLEIKAPIAGIIKNLKDLKAGQTIQSGQEIAQVIPLKNIEALLKIKPHDIKNIKVGQTVHLKVNLPDLQSVETLEGKITEISPAIFMDHNNKSFYKVTAVLSKSYLGENPYQHQLTPGIAITANIQVGEETMLDYLTSPLLKKFSSFH